MDVNGCYDAGRTIIGVPPVSNASRAVTVFHTGQLPVGTIDAPDTAIAIGTGDQMGKAWKKASTTPNNTDWVQILP
jgi:hypothetical protein